MNGFFCGALGAAVLVGFSAGGALAHVTMSPPQAAPSSTYRAVFQVGHGCDGAPTRTVHGTLSEGVKEIVWSGGPLPDDQFDEFVVSARITDAIAPEQDPHSLKEPAPGLKIVAATASAASKAVVTAGALRIENPWTRATPGGAKVAGGYLRVVNTGPVPDRLVGATFPNAGSAEVHAMSVEGGVMKMRPLEGGLEIRPGETVELKPGGNHLMFRDLRQGLKEGDIVQGTLVFERAGSVPIEFRVEGMGAQGPSAAGEHHH